MPSCPLDRTIERVRSSHKEWISNRWILHPAKFQCKREW
jgi:hypothetical protein